MFDERMIDDLYRHIVLLCDGVRNLQIADRQGYPAGTDGQRRKKANRSIMLPLA